MELPSYVYSHAFAYVFILHCIFGGDQASTSGRKRSLDEMPHGMVPKKPKVDIEAQKARIIAIMYDEDNSDRDKLRMLESEGLLNPDIGREWWFQNWIDANEVDTLRVCDKLGFNSADDIVRHLRYSPNLINVLRTRTLLDGQTRDWFVKSISDKDQLYKLLKEFNLLTAEPGIDWYVKSFGRSVLLVNVLKEVDLLHMCTYEWFLHVYGICHDHGGTLIDALAAAGKLDTIMDLAGRNKLRDWLTLYFRDTRGLFKALEKANLFNQDVSVEWYKDAFKSATPFQLKRVLKKTGYYVA
jgi:hypothetical protein